MYEQIKNRKFKEPNSLVSNAFLSVSGEDGLLNILVKKQKILGDFKSSRIVEWKTHRIEGSNPSNLYHFVYEVEYENYTAKETIDLVKEEKEVKILAYNINSDGFLK